MCQAKLDKFKIKAKGNTKVSNVPGRFLCACNRWLHGCHYSGPGWGQRSATREALQEVSSPWLLTPEGGRGGGREGGREGGRVDGPAVSVI